MAKPVKFNTKPKTPKGSTSFNFGFNTLTKGQKKEYRKKTGKGGGS